MLSRREWSEEARKVIEDQLSRIESTIGTGGVGTPKRSERDAMLGITRTRLGLARSPEERAGILEKAQSYVTGGSSFNLKGSQRRQLGQLAGMATAGGPSAGEMSSETNIEGFEPGGLIPGKVSSGGDDTTIQAKKGEYVLPVEVVDYIGVENLDKEVSGIKRKLGLNPKGHLQKKTGYQVGGEVEKPKADPVAFIERGDVGKPVQTVEKTPQGYQSGVISPEAADKLYAAWGIGKPSTALMPEAYMGTRFHIPGGLSQKDYSAKQDEIYGFKGRLSPVEEATYRTAEAGLGIKRRHADVEEALMPAKRDYYESRAGEARAKASKAGREEGDTKKFQAEARALDAQERTLTGRLNTLNKQGVLANQKEKSDIQAQLDLVNQRRNKLFGYETETPSTPTPAAKPVKAIQDKVKELQKQGMSNEVIKKHMKAKGLDPSIYGVK